jgi:uncharacterized protein (DUF1501 family)
VPAPLRQRLAQQRVVARMIEASNAGTGAAQAFFVSMGGFDNHDLQTAVRPT